MRDWNETARRAWPHLRAALIFFHIAAVLVMCLPPPGKIDDRARWKTPQARAELASWASRVRSLGIDVSDEGFEEFLWDLTHDYLAVRNAIAAPFEGYTEYLRLGQGWRMFTNPQTHPGRLHVEVEEPGRGWRTVYVARSDEHTWRRRQLDHNRVRKLIGRAVRWPTRGSYRRFCAWLAREAAAEFPDATRLRCRLWRWRTSPPGTGRDDEAAGRFESAHVFALEPLR